jgi:hypothetical protein
VTGLKCFLELGILVMGVSILSLARKLLEGGVDDVGSVTVVVVVTVMVAGVAVDVRGGVDMVTVINGFKSFIDVSMITASAVPTKGVVMFSWYHTRTPL